MPTGRAPRRSRRSAEGKRPSRSSWFPRRVMRVLQGDRAAAAPTSDVPNAPSRSAAHGAVVRDGRGVRRPDGIRVDPIQRRTNGAIVCYPGQCGTVTICHRDPSIWPADVVTTVADADEQLVTVG